MKYLLAGALLLNAVLAFYAVAKELPVEAFASAPTVDKLRLSPDGSKLSMIQTMDTDEQELVLVKLYDLETGEQRFLVKADSKDLTIFSVIWANNKQLLMRAAYATHRYGTPVSETRLMVIDVETGKNKSIVSGQLQRRLVRTPQFQSNIVDLMPADEHNFLLALDGFNTESAVSVVKVNLNGEPYSTVEYGRKGIYDWVADRQHRPRIALFRDDTRYEIREKLADSNDFRTLWQFEIFSGDEIWPIGFDSNPNILYVSAYHNGRLAIFSADISAEKPQLTLVKADENYDVPADIDYSWQHQKVIAIGGDYVDSAHNIFQKSLDAALPDADNHIVSTSHDQNRYIVESSSATMAGSYLLGDRKGKSLNFLVDKFANLKPELMVAKQKISYQARDNLTIEGFLTTPLGYQQTTATNTLPTIIFPHGGPISFDDEGFDYWTQFFANRGFAVLQMNFRGSHGYGFDFMQMGLQGWGLQMQDDVEDGTRWLIKQGIADPKRICIVGASYGGYAALMGAVKTPELYQCVVSFAGVTDVEDLVKSYRNFTNYEVVKKQLGDNFDLLEERSPVTYAEKIQVPVLLVHGTKDRSVSVKQSSAMYRALKKHDKDVQYIELEDGDHYLSTNSHRLETFQAMDRFLKLHLKVAAPTEATTVAADQRVHANKH